MTPAGCLVLVPVLGRPHRVAPLTESLRSTANAALLFLCSPGDDEQIASCKAVAWTCVVEWDAGPGDYARKMNHGFKLGIEHGYRWVFLAADDLRFHEGWFDAARACNELTQACVVGTNDMGNATVMRGEHSTHSLVHASYAECGTIDDPAKLLHEGYDHNYVDTEFIATAMHRETFAFAADSRVEHLHPFWHKGRLDVTYKKGQARMQEDSRLFESRKHLWSAP